MNYIKLDNISIDYCKFGNGKKPLIIIPGLSIKKVSPLEDAIKKQYSMFLNDYKIYVFDRRNNASSNITLEQLADDIVLAMNHLNIKKADFFGASQGGMIVQIIAGKYKELVNKIVLASTACRSNAQLKSTILKWIDIAKTYNGYLLNETISKDIHTEEIFNSYKEVLLAGGDNISEEEIDQFINIAQTIIDFDISRYTKKITCPTLIIEAKGDKVTTYEAGEFINKLINSNLLSYDETYGHAVYDEDVNFPNKIKEFLNF